MTTLRQRVPLRKRKIFKKSIGGILKRLPVAALVTVVFLVAIDFIAEWNDPIGMRMRDQQPYWRFFWFVGVGGWLFAQMIYEILYFLTYFYDADDTQIVIRKGVLTKKEVTLPFAKITDVYVDQDLFDVALGLYDLHISTPTVESGLFAHIDGIDKAGSQHVKKLILDKIQVAGSSASNSR